MKRAILILTDALVLLSAAFALGAVGTMFAIDSGLFLDEYGRIELWAMGIVSLGIEWPRDGIIAALRRAGTC